MTTALDIIKRSMRLLGVYSIGEDPTAAESADALTALNALVDTLPNSPLTIHSKTLDSITLVANQASYTVGPSGATVTPRPVEVLDISYITYQGVDYGLSKATQQDYNSIDVKTIGGIPGLIYPLMDMPNITVYLWPVPSEVMTLNLWSVKALTSFPALNTVVSLPLGYEQFLAFFLAETLAPEFEVQVPESVARECARIRRAIKRTNTEVPRLTMPYGIPNGNQYVDWRSL
jgi:hypothetical protein